TRAAGFTPYGPSDSTFVASLAELDDGMFSAYVDDEASISYARLCDELATMSQRGLVHPVFLGSAITGAGVDSLMAGIAELLPAREGDVDGPVSGSVFKIELGRAGEKVAYVRMFSGAVTVRDRLRF